MVYFKYGCILWYYSGFVISYGSFLVLQYSTMAFWYSNIPWYSWYCNIPWCYLYCNIPFFIVISYGFFYILMSSGIFGITVAHGSCLALMRKLNGWFTGGLTWPYLREMSRMHKWRLYFLVIYFAHCNILCWCLFVFPTDKTRQGEQMTRRDKTPNPSALARHC
jgi:hypothetical protein